MTKLLFVGDPHATPDELDDCTGLVDLIIKTAKQHDVDAVVLLGDQHHTHSVVRLEVTGFWRHSLERMRSAGINRIVMLKGNHDGYVQPGRQGSALDAYADFCPWLTIVNSVAYFNVNWNMLFVPYCHTEEEFRRQLVGLHAGAHTVVCHQTFNGAKFENGFPAPDGFDLTVIPQPNVISGHIHKNQHVGKCWYVGAPRWRTLSDANIDRNIWVVHYENDKMVSKQPVPTHQACRQIRQIVDSPEAPAPTDIDQNIEWHVDIQGPSEWVDARKAIFAGAGAHVRTTRTDRAVPRVKESEGIETSFVRYVETYTPRHGASKEALKRLIEERST